MSPMAVAGEVHELFAMLESPRPHECALAKSKLQELFSAVKDAWLVHGLADYQATTGSARAADALARSPTPHRKFLMDRIAEGLRAPGPRGEARGEALSLLGHLVRRQPLWLHELAEHALFPELLALLRTDSDTERLVDGVLVLVALLPMVPALVGPHLPDAFEAFARLAAWDGAGAGAGAPGSPPRGEREHLQLGLYLLFHDLYGMFPCNFVDFLRREYGEGRNAEIFAHTINPMLETVRMHPLLIAAGKTAETDGARWRRMEHHDVLVECRRFSAEGAEGAERPDREEAPATGEGEALFRARCGTDVAGLIAARRRPPREARDSTASASAPDLSATAPPTSVAALSAVVDADPERWFSLADACESSAVASAPHTPLPPLAPTPISLSTQTDARARTPLPPPPTPRDERTNGSASGGGGGSPPEAAIEATPENTPAKGAGRRFDFPADSPVVRKLNSRFVQGGPARVSTAPSRSQPPSPLKKEPSPPEGETAGSDRRRDAYYSQQRLGRVLRERSHRSAEAFPPAAPANPRAVPDGPVPLGTAAPAWGSTDWPLARPRPRFPDGTDGANGEDREVIELCRRGDGGSEREDGGSRWEEEAVCEGADLRCSDRRHGLHMPPSTSVLDFARKMTAKFGCRDRRATDVTVHASTGPRPETGRRRSRSCSDLETDVRSGPSFGGARRSEGTQTIEAWPTLRDRLVSDAIGHFAERNGENSDVSVIEDPSEVAKSPYVHVDRYVRAATEGRVAGENGAATSPETETESLRRQLKLLHLELLYERHRREVHAIRNRRLLGRAREKREAEEQNQALRRQIALMQNDIDDLRQQISKRQQTIQSLERSERENVKYWQNRIKLKEIEIEDVHREKEKAEAALLERQSASTETSADVQRLHAALFDATHQLQRALRRSEMGEKSIDCIGRLQTEVMIFGERELRLREAFGSVPTRAESSVAKMLQQCKEQLLTAQNLSQANLSKVETLQAREAELEHALTVKDQTLQELKKQMRLAKEEYGERLKSVEDKYQSIKRINQRMEAHCLELLQRVPQSPQAISRDLTSGFSPQSSPLSASLASSEGPVPILASRVDEIRNLQVIVNAHETIEESASNSINNVGQDDEHR